MSYRYLLYYAGFERSTGAEQIGVAGSDDLLAWKHVSPDPVIPRGSSGAADAAQTSNPCVLAHEGTYRMWYQGRDAEGRLSVCYAVSPDGIVWEARSEAVLSLPPGEKGHRAGYHHPHVLFDAEAGIFKLWCVSYKGGRSKVMYGESEDGLRWDLRPEPVFVPEEGWEGDRIFYPCILKEGGRYRMWYTGLRDRKTWGIGLAESDDGMRWHRVSRNPILPQRSVPAWMKSAYAALASLRIFTRGSRSSYGVASPSVWKDEAGYQMLVHEVGPAGKLTIARYSSADGRSWQQASFGLLAGDAGDWDSFFQADPYLLIV